jgi:hypothetical protein
MAGSGFLQSVQRISATAGAAPNGGFIRPAGGSGLNQGEFKAVLRHQSQLAEARGTEVSFQEALEDWDQHHALRWREERQREYLMLQREEIQRHKWIESEKARRDLGAQAVLDWIGTYAESWRTWYEQEHGETRT